MSPSTLRKLSPALAVLLALAPVVQADEMAQVREQLHALEQKLLILERKQEIKDEAAAAAAPTTPKVTISDKGFTLASADAANSLKLRALVQLDSRTFFNDGGVVNSTFALRRARLIFEGTFAKNYSFQLVPEFGGGSATAATTPGILDANIGIKVSPAVQLKIGKFKVPVGLELLQSDSWTFSMNVPWQPCWCRTETLAFKPRAMC